MKVQRLNSKSSWHFITVIMMIGILVFSLVGCAEKEPIRVGFVAQLTGVQAELGVQERNGAQLAVDEINAAGGVAGRPIELIVQDDLGTPEGARAADRKLINAGVVAIIGHASSAQTIAGLEVTNPARVVMLSPTATTPKLSGKDDYFFRVTYSLEDRADALAQHIYKRRELKKMSVIYDMDNAAYSKNYADAFAAKYQSLGGKVVDEINFSSKTQPNFEPLVAQLRTGNPDGLLIIASDIDTALIVQRTRLMGWQVPLFTTSWAQTETLIKNGGKAVEGLEVEVDGNLNSQTPEYLDFKKHYKTRFGQNPAFGATLGYEATKVLALALEETGGKAEGLREALKGIKNFKGLSETFSFDKYGDVVRSFYIGVIRDGKYVKIDSSNPTGP